MKILIADDEALVRIGLKSLLEGCESDYEIVEAEDGCEALKVFTEHFPALAFVDINMPRMDGLQFISEAKKLKQNCKFVAITCHNDPKYMREAIKTGLDDYIIKTEFSKSELLDIVRHTESECNARIGIIGLEAVPGRPEPAFEREFMAAMNGAEADLRFLRDFLCDHDIDGQFNLLEVALAEPVDESMERAIRNIIDGLVKEYSRGYSFKIPEGEYIILTLPSGGDNPNRYLGSLCDRLAACLKNYLNIEVSIGVYAGLDLEHIGGVFESEGISPKTAAGPQEGYYAEIVAKAKEFMKKNLDKKISLMDVADYVNVSPCHFSRIFKLYTGCNFIDYSMKLRIDRVKSLINGGTKITAAAGMIGYSNYSYFSKLFKKVEGMTPEEYKKAKATV